MNLTEFIQQMPKAELHVHLEGSVQPATLLRLAEKNEIALPARTIVDLRNWYQFTDFPHFIQVYTKLSECIRSAEDIEFIAREFIENQAAQNILYSEVTYTAYTHFTQKGISFEEQMAALNRARAWGIAELGATMNFVIDIARHVSAGQGLELAQWVTKDADHHHIVALGLGGPEVGHPPEKFLAAFEWAERAGLPAVPHAGETVGPPSIWGAIEALHAVRIGHGVRCLEDVALVDELRRCQIPLEVCPSSNLCLKIFHDMHSHALPQMLDEGLYITINSDDPPLFNTTLTDEYLLSASAYDWNAPLIQKLVMNAVNASLMPADEKATLHARFSAEFGALNAVL